MAISSSKVKPAKATSEQYSLFRGYIDERHADGGMADMTVLDFAAMVDDSFVDSRIVEYRSPSDIGERAACRLRAHRRPHDGLSMIYSFYEPDLAPNGASGPIMILDHIQRAATLRPALSLSRLLGAGLAEDELQVALHASGTADGRRLGPPSLNRRYNLSVHSS